MQSSTKAGCQPTQVRHHARSTHPCLQQIRMQRSRCVSSFLPGLCTTTARHASNGHRSGAVRRTVQVDTLRRGSRSCHGARASYVAEVPGASRHAASEPVRYCCDSAKVAAMHEHPALWPSLVSPHPGCGQKNAQTFLLGASETRGLAELGAKYDRQA